MARAVDGVVAVTGRQVPPLQALGYPRRRIEVVPNRVFARHVESSPRPSSTAMASPRSAWPASRPEKRVDLFIRAVGEARREIPSVRGYVAGEGREHEQQSRSHVRPGWPFSAPAATCSA